jgi:hypothetical protein
VPDSPRYATIQDLRDRGVPLTVTDQTISDAIVRSQEFIDLYTRQRFSPVGLIIDMDGSGDDSQFLDDYPINSLSLVKYRDGNAVQNYISVDLTPDTKYPGTSNQFVTKDIVVENDIGIIVGRTFNWPIGTMNVHLEGNFGMAETPALIKEVTIQMALAGGLIGDPLLPFVPVPDPNVTSESIGDYSYSKKVGFSSIVGFLTTGNARWDAILSLYRRAPLMRVIRARNVEFTESTQSRLDRIISGGTAGVG